MLNTFKFYSSKSDIVIPTSEIKITLLLPRKVLVP
jgi:hypothetical protein